MIKRIDESKEKITIFEAVTDKIINANSMSVKKPKVLRLTEMFPNLFKLKNKKEQSIEEQIAMLRKLK